MIELNCSITIVNPFAERLRSTRILRSLSQARLAQACGLSQSAIANYENGTRKTAKDIFRLAEVLAVSPSWLATGTGPREPLPEPPPAQPLYLLNESPDQQALAPWPFPDTSPEEYWALPEEVRAMVGNMLTSLIKSLQKNLTNP